MSLRQLKVKQNEIGGFLHLLSVGKLGASLLGNILPGKEVVRADRGESRARK